MKNKNEKYITGLTSIGILACGLAFADSSSKEQESSPFSPNGPTEFEPWDPNEEWELDIDQLWIELDKIDRLNELGKQLEDVREKDPFLFEIGMCETAELISKANTLEALLEEVGLLDEEDFLGQNDSTNPLLDSIDGHQRGSAYGPLVSSMAEYFALAREQSEQMGLGRNQMGADPLISQQFRDDGMDTHEGLYGFYDALIHMGPFDYWRTSEQAEIEAWDLVIEQLNSMIMETIVRAEEAYKNGDSEKGNQALTEGQKLTDEKKKAEEKRTEAGTKKENDGITPAPQTDDDADESEKRPDPNNPEPIDPSSPNFRLYLELLMMSGVFRELQVDPLAPIIMPAPDAAPVNPDDVPEAMYDPANGDVDPWINPGEEPTVVPEDMPEPEFNPNEGGVIDPSPDDAPLGAGYPHKKPEKDPPSPFMIK